MNTRFLGDSYDVVKRFFCGMARSAGYDIFVEPMFTGDWTSAERSAYLRFLEARAFEPTSAERSAAILVDPDTGIRSTPSGSHVTFDLIAARCKQFALVLVFDQAFARNQSGRQVMTAKLQTLRALGVRGLYYASHARFLLCSRSSSRVMRLHKSLIQVGLPAARFVGLPASAA